MMDFENATVVITGASRGIGRAIAEGFASFGARLQLLADDPSVLTVADELFASGHVADITNSVALDDVFSKIGHIDVLVNNAGLERLTPLSDLSEANAQTFRRIVDVNITGTFLATRHALPRMGANGRVISTSSAWGRAPEPLFSAYVASKHAIIGLTKTWAKELGPRGITANAVAPGWVRTDASLQSLEELARRQKRAEQDMLDDILSGQALDGLMDPTDVVGPYLFLASPMSANITGQTIGIDRGEVPY
jgi:NAD(P)-dependent dehydrogenase (short-subunit alcohol dehydrogenase family)